LDWKDWKEDISIREGFSYFFGFKLIARICVLLFIACADVIILVYIKLR